MKCELPEQELKICKTCGFKTNNMLIMVCPRCTATLPGPASCSGDCSKCHLGVGK